MNITFDDFKKIEIRVGKVLTCEKIENADKLLRLQVDFGDFKRQIISGIAQWYDPKDSEGKFLPSTVNLEPRNFRGEESQGMLMAAEGEDGPVFLEPSKDIKEGTLVV